ncbi:hypothetical protein [Propionibacterium freudenreichii]|nr:hypothetical protein [Propionibacterium freudenreichii]
MNSSPTGPPFRDGLVRRPGRADSVIISLLMLVVVVFWLIAIG